jgi:hypothetical protein
LQSVFGWAYTSWVGMPGGTVVNEIIAAKPLALSGKQVTTIAPAASANTVMV